MANSRQHSELIGDDRMPVTRGHMVAMYPTFHSLWTPLATLQGLGSGTELKRPPVPGVVVQIGGGGENTAYVSQAPV